MFTKKSVTVLGVFAAVQGALAAPQVLGVSETDTSIPNDLPPHVKARWSLCSGKGDDGSVKPCTRETNINSVLLAESGALSGRADKMQAYRTALLKSTEYKSSQDCCFKCKRVNGIHSEAEDTFWRDWYSQERFSLWSAAVDEAAKTANATAPDRWAFTNGEFVKNNGTYPIGITVDDQLKITKTQTENEYCPNSAGGNVGHDVIKTTHDVKMVIQMPCSHLMFNMEVKGAAGNSTAFVALFFSKCQAVGTPGNMRHILSPPTMVEGTYKEVEPAVIAKANLDKCPEQTNSVTLQAVWSSLASRTGRAPPELVNDYKNNVEVSVSANLNVVVDIQGGPATSGNSAVLQKPATNQGQQGQQVSKTVKQVSTNQGQQVSSVNQVSTNGEDACSST